MGLSDKILESRKTWKNGGQKVFVLQSGITDRAKLKGNANLFCLPLLHPL